MPNPATGTTKVDDPPMRIVRLALPVPLHQLFDYSVPEAQALPVVGGRVQVPFGPRKLIGLCVAIEPPDAHAKTRPILATIDDTPLLDTHILAMAHWLSDYYHHPIGEVYAALLPSQARQGATTQTPTEPAWRAATEPTDLARAPKQLALYQFAIAAQAPLNRTQLNEAGFSSALVNQLTKRGGLEKTRLPQSLPLVTAAAREQPLALMPEQLDALTHIRQGDGYRTILLEGVTGSGKTEVYLQCIADIVAAGRQALVLVPEIALTPQTVGRFAKRFGSAAALHSQLSDNDRWQIWLGCRCGSISVVIGTRSAALTPFANLGLIVVDEEHDASFKQNDGLRYSARDVAVKRAHELNIPLILGSATPALETLHNANLGRYQHLKLRQRAGGAAMPSYRVLDIRGQQSPDGISEPLARVIRQHLDAGNQALLFINRRGFSPSLLCHSCGSACACQECDMPMTYHSTPGQTKLICHHCSRQQPAPQQCPSCGATTLLPVGVGTQRTEQGLAARFGDVPVYRIDRDTVRSASALEAQFAKIHQGQPALLVGTQMLAKGHHFADVTLVAILNADAGFASPDFRAPERTAALIVQVAGRAGREAKAGEVWVQTLQPQSPMLSALVNDGYAGFAARELPLRVAAGLPPATHIALIRAESPDAQLAEQHLIAVQNQLQQQILSASLAGVQVMGPVPAPIPRINNRVRLQLMLLSDERKPLHRLLRGLQQGPKPPNQLRWSIDVDPFDAY